MFLGFAHHLLTSGKDTLPLSQMLVAGGNLWIDVNIILWQSDALSLNKMLTKYLYSVKYYNITFKII